MADNFNISTADGEKTIATDAIEDVHHQRVKLRHGIDGINNGDVARTNPLPVQAYLESGTIHDGSSQLPVKFAYKNITVDADIIGAVATKKIRVLGLNIDEQDQTADVILAIEDSSGGSVLAEFAGMDLEAKGLSFSPVGWFETTAGNALYGNVSGTTPDLNICVVYVEV